MTTEWFYEHYRDKSAIGIRTTAKLHQEKSPFQEIEVFDTAAHGRLLTLDQMVMVTELDEFVYHEQLVHIPMIHHPNPQEVLVIGGGDGGSVREVCKHAGVKRVVQCEIDERVTRVCEEYFPTVASAFSDPRVELVFEDAAAYVARHPNRFDAILIDSSEPIGPAKALFESKFFGDVKAALRPGGIMSCQAESPFFAPDIIEGLFDNLRFIFANGSSEAPSTLAHPVRGYLGLMPTYPGGSWLFGLACNNAEIPAPRLEALEALQLRYLNRELASACFALPNFCKSKVYGNTHHE